MYKWCYLIHSVKYLMFSAVSVCGFVDGFSRKSDGGCDSAHNRCPSLLVSMWIKERIKDFFWDRKYFWQFCSFLRKKIVDLDEKIRCISVAGIVFVCINAWSTNLTKTNTLMNVLGIFPLVWRSKIAQYLKTDQCRKSSVSPVMSPLE